MKTSIPVAPPSADPNAGARKMPGKSNMQDGALIKGPAGKAVTEAPVVPGVARRCIDIQVSGDDKNSPNGNPKRRTRNRWGTNDDEGK